MTPKFAILAGIALLPLHATAIEAAKHRPVTREQIKVLHSSQTWGTLHLDKSVTGTPLSIASRKYASGLGTHATSEIVLDVPPDAIALEGACGIDDATGPGAVTFSVLSGNRALWSSREIRAKEPANAFRAELMQPGTRVLHLMAYEGNDNGYDHANWVDLRWVVDPAAVAAKPQPRPQIFSSADFGFQPDSADFQDKPMEKALDSLRANPGSTLKFVPGTYRFSRIGSPIARHFSAPDHTTPVTQVVSFPLVDLRDVTIDGSDARFIFNGTLLPMAVMDSERVTIRDIHIDFARANTSQAEVMLVDKASNACELRLDPATSPYRVENGRLMLLGPDWVAPVWKLNVFNPTTRRIADRTGDIELRGKASEIQPGLVRIEGWGGDRRVGEILCLRHAIRGGYFPAPGIFIERSHDVRLQGVFVHQAAGAGIMVHRTDNFSMEGGGVTLKPQSQRVFTTNAEGLHVTDCSGLVRIEGASFENTLDDAIAIHPHVPEIVAIEAADTLRCPNRVIDGAMDLFQPGDKVEFFSTATRLPVGSAQVESVAYAGNDAEIRIRFNAPIPAGIKAGDAIANADLNPRVEIRSCTIRNNRARGLQVLTPKPVLVEDCNFDHCSGSAILIADDWNYRHRMSPCSDVLVRRNRFTNNLTTLYEFCNAIVTIVTPPPRNPGQAEPIHRNLRFEDNVFETFPLPLLQASSTRGLSFVRNTVRYNREHVSSIASSVPFILDYCSDVTIRDNKVSYPDWSAADAKLTGTPASEVRTGQ